MSHFHQSISLSQLIISTGDGVRYMHIYIYIEREKYSHQQDVSLLSEYFSLSQYIYIYIYIVRRKYSDERSLIHHLLIWLSAFIKAFWLLGFLRFSLSLFPPLSLSPPSLSFSLTLSTSCRPSLLLSHLGGAYCQHKIDECNFLLVWSTLSTCRRTQKCPYFTNSVQHVLLLLDGFWDEK